MARLLKPDEYVPYTIEHHDGRTMSACQSFSDGRSGFVSANEVASYGNITEGRNFYRSYKRACEQLGVTGVEASLGGKSMP